MEGVLDGVEGRGGDDLVEGFASWGEGRGVLVGREGLGAMVERCILGRRTRLKKVCTRLRGCVRL